MKMASLMVAGVGVAAAALAARFAVQAFRQVRSSKLPRTPSFTSYYKGGFEPKMTRREAGLILGKLVGATKMASSLTSVGISPSSSKERVREVHRRVMILNHPDKGGSPYLATKINEAKDYLENAGKAERH